MRKSKNKTVMKRRGDVSGSETKTERPLTKKSYSNIYLVELEWEFYKRSMNVMDPINPPNPPNILSTTTKKPKTTTPDNPETEPTTPLNLETEPQDPTPDALSTTTKKPKRTTPLSLETTTVSTMLSLSSKICY